MEVTGFIYQPRATVRFTREDVAVLTRCSKCHYDNRCKDQSVQGGLLWAFNNEFAWMDPDQGTLERTLDFNKLDTLCKTVEVPPPDVEKHGRELHKLLFNILTRLNEEYRRLNPET
jgi:hypothetical protein